jgi:DNA-directed RNA polymerase subunit K/omega
MSRFPLEETEKKVGSKYCAVIAIAKQALRTRQRTIEVPSSRRSNLLRGAMEDILAGRVKVIKEDNRPKEQPGGRSEEEG